MDDVSVVQNLASGPALVTLVEVATAIGAGLWLGSLSWRLAACVAGLAPLYALVFWLYARPIRAGAQVVRSRLDQVFTHLKQKLDGMLVVRAAAQEIRETAEFTRQIAELHQPRVQVGGLAIAFSQCCQGLSGLFGVLIFGVGASEVLAGRLAVADLIAATMLAGLMLAPLPRLADLAAQLQQARASWARLAEILAAPLPTALTSPPQLPSLSCRGQVSFRRVAFRYRPDLPLFDEFTLDVAAGQRLAIVGPTGSGKSTLVQLLLRFYDPEEGEILLDGRPITQLPVAQLRQSIGLVPQEAAIFRGTLADNIRYGAPDASAAEVEAAARGALVHELALRLPRGYDTIIGEGGHPLSLGERQRIAIARILCKNPAVVVLDEATSSLDADSEALVRRALDRLLAGRTTIAIAHRLETIQAADAIAVLQQGQLVQFGRHQELLEDAAGLYRQLHDTQFADVSPRLPRQPFLEPAAA
jgi:ABC-type multidrug transport system fused ATPase/permease subunit